MDEHEEYIRDNIASVLSHRKIKELTTIKGGVWSLHSINGYSGRQKNIEFSILVTNGKEHLIVSAKINRESKKLSEVNIRDN